MLEKILASKVLNRNVPVRFFNTYDSINTCQEILFESLDDTLNSCQKGIQEGIFTYYSGFYPEMLSQLKNYRINETDIQRFMPEPTTSDELVDFYKIQYIRMPDKKNCHQGEIILHYEVDWDGNSNLPVYIQNNKVIRVGNLDIEQ